MKIFVLDESDPRWGTLRGGYKVPYNPLPALKRLQDFPADQNAWKELWENLHHQGDVGEVSYLAAVVLLGLQTQGAGFDWNCYGLVSTIEMQRTAGNNPSLPVWLEDAYKQAWANILPTCLNDIRDRKYEETFALQAVFSVIALAQGFATLGRFLATVDDGELEAYFTGEWPE